MLFSLADLANFIENMKVQYKALDSPVITFGCSYSGALAAWFRIKYPTITLGSIASSAPVQAVLDFYAYDDVVDNSIKTIGGQTCVDRIQAATNAVQAMLQTSQGQQQLEVSNANT